MKPPAGKGEVPGATPVPRRQRSLIATLFASPRRRYAIAPQDLVRAQREAREHGLAIVGFYHSHPDHAAAPSATDSKEAYWDGCSYVIVETQAGRAGELRSYVLRDGQLAEEAVR